jgi:hypothetical protein
MSQSVTVIGGAHNGQLSGLVTIPISGVPSSEFSQIQSLLSGLTASVTGGTIGFFNDNLTASGQTSGVLTIGASSVGSSLLELTNTDSTGVATAGNVSISATIPSSYTTIVAEAPGTMSLTGASAGGATYVFGAATNVDLTAYGSNTIYAGGGSDTLNPGSGSSSITYTSGNSSVNVQSGSNSIAATGNATVSVHVNSGFSGTINFVNSSTASAGLSAGAGSATVFGGAAGGTFLGGTAGNNSLVGGSGSAFLVGGGNNDFLKAGGNTDGVTSSGSNYLFSGTGNETLFASSLTGSNLLAGGSGADSITSDGTGAQYFFASDGSTTMTGSTTSGAANTYFFGGPASTTGGNDLITNFKTSRDALNVLGGADIQAISSTSFQGAPGALVTLTDGTHITMLGVSAASIAGSVGGKSIV